MIVVGTCHSAFVKTHRAYNASSEPQEGLWAMLYQCRLANCNKCTPLVGDVEGHRGNCKEGVQGGL